MEMSAPVKLRMATHAGFNQGMATFVAPDRFRSSGESSLVPAERIYLQRDTERRKAAEPRFCALLAEKYLRRSEFSTDRLS